MGRNKQNNYFKKQYLEQAVKYIEKLEKENKALKEDPNTIIGQFIGQYREIYGQNSRLSVLSASLIKKLTDLGTQVRLTKEEMEQFKGHRINIKWELPEGVEKPEDATEFIFTYELQAEPEAQPVQVQATEQPGVCTDPDCTLPKELAHVHTAAPDVEVTDEVIPGANTDGTALVAPPALTDEQVAELVDFGPGEEVLANAIPADLGDEISSATSSVE